MLRQSSRVVTLAASLVLAVSLLSLLVPRASGDDLTGNLMGQVLALQARLDLLENKMQKLERDPTFEGGLSVVDFDNKLLMRVSGQQDGASVMIGQGNSMVQITAGQDGSISIGQDGQSQAKLSLSGDDVQLLLGQEGGLHALIHQQANGTDLVLGSDEGKQARLTMDADGGELVIGDSRGRQARLVMRGDFTELLLGQDSGRQVHIIENGEGAKQTIGNGGSPDITLDGKGDGGIVTVGKPGGNVIALKQQGSDGKITIGPAGAGVVTLAAAGKGGELYFGTAEGKSVNLATNENGGKLELGKSDGTRVQIGTIAGDQAIVQVGVGDRRASLQAGSQIVGMLSQSDDGAGQFGSFDGGFGMLLSKGGGRLAMLGQDDGDDPALQLYGTGGTDPSVVLQGQGQGGKLFLGAGGEDAAINLKTNGSNDSQLLMGKSGSPHVEIVAAQAETSLMVVDGNNKAGTFSDGSQLKLITEDGGDKAELGKSDRGWGLMLSQAQQLAAGLSTLEGKGLALRMYDQGQQVGAFGASPDGSGGTLRIYSGGSGATVSLSAEGGAGMVTAFNESGAPVLKLNAALQAFVVFSTGGTPIAALSKTRTNAGGEVAIYGPGGDVVFGAASMPEGGGAACAKRASGKGDCLGVGLPLMGGGN